ncbi:twin-arginine translocase TatA/TatE family subunit [Paenibacillus sp. V4I5]|uniref:twin-arginine translocase TatA/TatE family subunit n=1 Tax=Paenibacillus sp. V4I5 TaxID=3042306 RepID=UPI00278D1409|nr:twin-arginine translocase TatA/TatE family subunit [Paenibacillus sp. V4I5]MDQ0917625.1 TatA/E family protein of Tat protein translocase [Paenibacillus sp. V4I5]
MFQNIGFTELLLIAIVALVIFGPQKLPEIGRVLGRTISDFKKGAHALLNDEPEEAAAQVKPAPQVSTQGGAATSNAVEAGTPSERAAVAFVSAAPAVVESAVEPSAATPEVAESVSSATAEPKIVHAVVQPVDASLAQSGSSTATEPSASQTAVSAVEAPSVTPTAPAQTEAASAPTAAPAPTSAPKAAPIAPPSNTRRLPD